MSDREAASAAKQRSLAEQLELRDLEVTRLQKEMASSRSAWSAIESVQAQVEAAGHAHQTEVAALKAELQTALQALHHKVDRHAAVSTPVASAFASTSTAAAAAAAVVATCETGTGATRRTNRTPRRQADRERCSDSVEDQGAEEAFVGSRIVTSVLAAVSRASGSPFSASLH